MPQTLELNNGPGFVIQDAVDNFVRNINDKGTITPVFEWNYDVQAAINASTSYGYENTLLTNAIEDSVEYLTSPENIYNYISYGAANLGYANLDVSYTDGSGSIIATINEDVISDLVSDDLFYADYSFNASSYEAGFFESYGYESSASESARISDQIYNQTTYLAEYLPEILSDANDVSGLDYLGANPDLDTIITSSSLEFQSDVYGYHYWSDLDFSLNFDEATFTWGVYGDIDTSFYGGYFNQTDFESDLEMEINNRYVNNYSPPEDPNYENSFYERYQSLIGEIAYDPIVQEFLSFNNPEYALSRVYEAINFGYEELEMFRMDFGFDPHPFIEIYSLAKDWWIAGHMPIFPGSTPEPPMDYVDSLTIASDIAEQLNYNNFEFLDSGYDVDDFDAEFEIALQDIAYSLNNNGEEGTSVYIENPATAPYFVEGISDPIIQSELTELNPLFPVEPKFDSEAINLAYQFVDEDGDVIENILVLGDDSSTTYTLQIIADTLIDGFTLDAADIEFGFNTNLFDYVENTNISISEDYQTQSSFFVDDAAGKIRFAGANLTDIETGGVSTERISSNVLASIELDFNEDGLSSLAKNADGSFVDSSLGFSLSANLNDTVLSRDIDGGFNKEIYSAAQFGGDKFTLEGSTDVFLYEQKAGIIETGDGLFLSTDRIIGADAAVTNLVRSGDTLSASTSWLNIGNVELDIMSVSGGGGNVELVDYELSKNSLLGGIFEGGTFTSSSDTADLTADFEVIGQAGQVVDLKNVLDVETSVGDDIFTNSSGTKNLITYQGDLNYDGRVSMKDLAYLNAGAARVNSGGDVAGDVDANFDDSIDILDLAVLDKDWGKSLHQGDEGFLGSSEITWEDLDKQGEISWDNSVFKEQNAFETFDGFVGSLESPTSNVIGADGNTVVNDDDMLGNTYQDLG